jgi:hypothetical protein
MEKRVGTDSIGESRSHFNVPPYLAHHDPKVPDGFGDVAFLVEYRVLSANEEQGSYILTGFLGWSLRSGQYTNGALHAGHHADNWVRQRVRRFQCPRQVRSRSSCRLYFHHLLHRGLRVELHAYHGLLALTARKADISRAISTGHIICYRQCSWCALVIRAGRVLRCAVPVFSNKRKSLFSPLARKDSIDE